MYSFVSKMQQETELDSNDLVNIRCPRLVGKNGGFPVELRSCSLRARRKKDVCCPPRALLFNM
jgi:hypothetical protein